jgi:hypothetical protein
MSGKNFVNQFKNTRRLAGLQNRRPLGGQTGNDFGKKVKKLGRPLKKTYEWARPGKKYSGPKDK